MIFRVSTGESACFTPHKWLGENTPSDIWWQIPLSPHPLHFHHLSQTQRQLRSKRLPLTT